MESNNQYFQQFSDNLRLETNSLANLSLNDSIWSSNYPTKERRNFNFRNGSVDQVNNPKPNVFTNQVWNNDDVGGNGNGNFSYSGYGSGLNGGFNKGIYSTLSLDFNGYSKGFANNNVVVNGKVNKSGKNEDENIYGGGKFGKKSKGNRESNKESNGNGENKSGVDKRFKTLPQSESLPRNETIGGYIFLKRELFGLPPRYRDSVRMTPGLPLFLYNYSTHQLDGIVEAASFGGTNIDPTAWEDKKNPGESRFPAQVSSVQLRDTYCQC